MAVWGTELGQDGAQQLMSGCYTEALGRNFEVVIGDGEDNDTESNNFLRN